MQGGSFMIRVGLAQMDIVWENIEENKKKVESLLKDAVSAGADLVIFPEMTLTGFSMNTSLADYYKEQKHFFSKMAGDYRISIICGLIAPGKKDKFENHLLMVDEEGREIMEYAKIHPFSFGREGRYYTGGDKVYVCSWHDTALSGFICYDLRFPQIFQAVSGQTQLIVVIANWPMERISHWDTLLKARAIENSCYVIGVNRTGKAGKLIHNGHSAVYDFFGERVSPLSEEEGLVLADLEPDKVSPFRESFPLLKDRRMDLYKQLVAEIK